MVNNQRLVQIRARIEEAEIRVKVAQEYLEEMRQSLVLYSKHPDLFEPAAIGRVANTLNARLARSHKASTKRERILNAAMEILSDGQRRFARALLPELVARGVKVSGRNEDIQRTNLAAYLSKSGKFEASNKLGGWTIRKPADPKTKAGIAPTIPASSNGALPGHPPLAGSPREGGFQLG